MHDGTDMLRRQVAEDQRSLASTSSSQRSLTGAEAAMVVEQIAGLTSAGLTLPGGLRAMAAEVAAGPLPAVLQDLAGRLEQGEPLASALGSQGARLPEHLRGLIRAGVESGRLADVLSRYVHHVRMARQLRRKMFISMIYPTILLVVFTLIFWFMLILIVPKFKRLFMDFGVELPTATRVLMYLSDWAVQFALPAFVFLVITLLCLWLLCSFLLGPPARRRLLHRLPLVGPLWQYTALAEFARLLALLVERELPLPQSLRLAATGLSDAAVADAALGIASDIEGGQSLSDSPVCRARLPAVLAHSLLWGDSSQALAESLQTAAEMIESQARVRAEFVRRAAAPITMILIVLLLGFIVLALCLPITQGIHELSG